MPKSGPVSHSLKEPAEGVSDGVELLEHTVKMGPNTDVEQYALDHADEVTTLKNVKLGFEATAMELISKDPEKSLTRMRMDGP